MIWDAVKAKMVKCLKGNDQGIWNLNYTKNGKNFVSASPDGVCKMWDARSGKETAKYHAHKRRVSIKWRNFLSVPFIVLQSHA
jgi:WD40 repeat protein